MKFVTKLGVTSILFAFIILMLNGCKPGCTDSTATNYDPEATEDDGTCTYATDTIRFELTFKPVVNTADFTLENNYTDPDGNLYKFTTFKYYVSNLTLISNTGSEVKLRDIVLVDYNSEGTEVVKANVENGNYVGIKFDIGVPPALNATDPASYAAAHPLSTYAGTYWSWSTQYRFVMIDGKIDTTGTGNNFTMGIGYHTGTDTLFRSVNTLNSTFTIADNQVVQKTLHLDIEKIFFSANDTIDFVTDPYTHVTDDFPLALRIADHFASAFSF